MTEDQEAEVADEPEPAEETETEPEADLEDVAEEEPADEESAETAPDADEEGGLELGDYVKLDYTAYTVEGGQLVDTTDPEVAEEEGVDDQDREIAPRTIELGEGHVFGSVEDAIVGGSVGDTGTVTVPAVEAFGEYDRENVRTISADKLDEDDRRPGAHVHIDGDHGHVEAIIGGRARVDFNHPLAGEDIEYEYEILDVVEDRLERAKALFSVFLDVSPEMWFETDEVEEEVVVEPDEDADDDEAADEDADDDEAADADDDEAAEPETELQTVEKETLYIESTPQLSMNQQWMFSKQQIAQQLITKLDIDRVIVQEILEGPGGMGGLGGMMGGMGGMGGDVDLEDADISAEDIAEELDDIEE